MGIGDYLSTKAEHELTEKERRREAWEFENYPEGEIAEMVELYEARGISHEDSSLIMHTLAKYPKAFVDIMMVEELQMDPDPSEDPAIGGLITFISFVLFGCIPLLPYFLARIVSLSLGAQLRMSLVLTAVTMFALGSIKGTFVVTFSFSLSHVPLPLMSVNPQPSHRNLALLFPPPMCIGIHFGMHVVFHVSGTDLVEGGDHNDGEWYSGGSFWLDPGVLALKWAQLTVAVSVFEPIVSSMIYGVINVVEV